MNGEKPVKVLNIIGGLGMGGAETWLMELLRLGPKKSGLLIDLLCTSGEPGIFDKEARQLGAEVFYIRYGRAHLGQFTREFRQLLQKKKYDVIHDHADYASGWHFLLGLGVLPSVRIAHVHNPWLHIESNYAINPVRKFTSRFGQQLLESLASNICGTSRQILQEYGFNAGRNRLPRVSVIHCGIDIEKFNAPRDADRQSVLNEFGWSPLVKVILFAGRLDRSLEFDHPQNHKNSWFALNVARVAAEHDPEVRFLMAGAGDDQRRQLDEHIVKWGMADKLRLIGVRQDLPRLMRAADVLFFPSRQEGLGMVAVEAQAAGLPVLASTAVPQECIVIPDLFNALSLQEPLKIWSAMLLQIMAKPRINQAICRHALESSAFSISNSARSLLNIYRSNFANPSYVKHLDY